MSRTYACGHVANNINKAQKYIKKDHRSQKFSNVMKIFKKSLKVKISNNHKYLQKKSQKSQKSQKRRKNLGKKSQKSQKSLKIIRNRKKISEDFLKSETSRTYCLKLFAHRLYSR